MSADQLPATSGGPARTPPKSTSAVSARPTAALGESDGSVLSAAELAEQVGWLLDLIETSETQLLSQLWLPSTFAQLEYGIDSVGRALPSSASVVADRLGWRAQFPDGLYVPSRVARIVQAQAVSTLRTLAFRDRVIQCELAGRDGDAPHAFTRGVHRQIARWMRTHPGHSIPSLTVTDLQDAPQVSRRARLGAVDNRFATLLHDGCAMLALRIKLPTTTAPTCRKQWQWITLTVAVPQHLRTRPITAWHLPEVTVDHRGVLLRFAFDESTPAAPKGAELRDVTAVVGVDWSPKDLAVAVLVQRDPATGEFSSDLRGQRFNDRGLGVKLSRLQTEGQFLHAKAERITALADNADPAVREALHARADHLSREAQRCGDKRQRINRDMAFLAANHVLAVAQGAGASVIAVEDLSTLEARRLGVNNNMIAQSCRRRALDALTHLGARNGMTVIETFARGTSHDCPGCDTAVLRPRGYHSAACRRCGLDVTCMAA